MLNGKDISNNESGVSTLTVSNIDKINPTVVYGTNGASNLKNASTTVTVSDLGGSAVNASTLQYVWNTQNVTTPTSGWATFTNGNAITKNGVTGTYYLWIKGSDNAGNSITEKSNAFVMDNTPPTNPTISASPTTWTNGNVTVTITYPADATVKEYSTNGSTWIAYTSAVTIASNLTVYARAADVAGNQSGQATLSIANIDKVAPTVTASNGGTTSSSVTVTASASDTGGSGLVATSYQYSKDNGVTWTSTTNATSYTFNSLTTGTYQCKVKVADNAGNSTISSAVAITTASLGTITLVASPTTWTNGDVTVTITYPAAVVTKQYSTNGTTWNTYTTPVVISTNSTTVYAKGSDSAGNQTAQATITVSNIDKIYPTITASNGGTTSSSVTVTASASDSGGSGLNTSSYQYSNDNGSTWTSNTSATSYTFSGLSSSYTYVCKVRVTDIANNLTTSNSISITTAAAASTPSNMTAYRGNIGSVYTYTITGNSSSGSVWGTDIYTDDSSIAKAAVHAGKLSNGQTGTVRIQMLAGQSSYSGTTRYGVTTSSYGSWGGSYKFL